MHNVQARLPESAENQVLPAEPDWLERGEVRVAGDPGAALGNRQRRVLGIGNQLPDGVHLPAEMNHFSQMPARWGNHPATGVPAQMLDRGQGDGSGSS